jgi:hypothetical protein
MATDQLVVRRQVRFSAGERGRRKLRAVPTTTTGAPAAAIPRISRLMALAIVLDELIRSGQVASYHELAQLCHVSRSRICQVMALVELAPDLQETLLFLPPGSDRVTEHQLRASGGEVLWTNQRLLCDNLEASLARGAPNAEDEAKAAEVHRPESRASDGCRSRRMR